MIIGITGAIGAGKGTVAEHLVKKGFKYYSLSDVIRQELKSRKDEPSRDNMIRTGNELRIRYGAGVLAEKTSEWIKDEQKSGRRDFVVDSIRNPSEVSALRKLDKFFLIAINAPQKTRFMRIKARKRENEPRTWREFVKRDNFERKNPGDSNQQVEATMNLANCIIKNDSTKEKLFQKVDNMLVDIRKIEQNRPDADDYFLKIASVVAERSTCIRRHVGAVAVKNKQIISTGYNGAPSGARDCLELGCLRNELGIKSGTEQQICRAVHAEQNAIIQAAIHGKDISGSTIYCTHSPCIICAKMLVNAKISRFVTYSEYSEDAFRKLFEEAGIEIVKRKRPDERIIFML